jgi:hypothetical protein
MLGALLAGPRVGVAVGDLYFVDPDPVEPEHVQHRHHSALGASIRSAPSAATGHETRTSTRPRGTPRRIGERPRTIRWSGRGGAVVERIPLVDPDDDDVDASTRARLSTMRDIGADFNVMRAMANHPGILDGFMKFSAAAYWGSSVEPPLRELAYLTASAENRCHY